PYAKNKAGPVAKSLSPKVRNSGRNHKNSWFLPPKNYVKFLKSLFYNRPALSRAAAFHLSRWNFFCALPPQESLCGGSFFYLSGQLQSQGNDPHPIAGMAVKGGRPVGQPRQGPKPRLHIQGPGQSGQVRTGKIRLLHLCMRQGRKGLLQGGVLPGL